MTETKSANNIARQRVEDLSDRGAEPGWLKEIRLSAWEKYLKAPAPSASDSQWRRLDLSGLDLNQLPALDCPPATQNKVALSSQQLKLLGKLGPTAGSLFQETQAPGLVELAKQWQEQGVIFTDWHQALEKHPDLVRSYLKLTDSQDQEADKFDWLNQAMFNCGLFLYVPANVEIDLPLVSSLSLQGQGALFPRLLVVAGAHSKFSLIQRFDGQVDRSTPASTSLVAGLTQIYAEAGSQVSYLELNDLPPHVLSINRTQNQIFHEGSFHSLTVALGSQQLKQDITTRLQAPGAYSQVLGAILGRGNQQYSFNTIEEHNATDTTSDINFRVALKDAASSTYQGIIRVSPVAQRTSAYQSNKNLLLGSQAKADSIPKLEILADDVKCSHGATVGPVDPEQVFYLMSRGLPLAQAEQLIVLGFFRQVLEQFPCSSVLDWLVSVVAQKLYSEPGI